MIEAWKGDIVGAEIGSTWYWTSGNPPGGALPVVFLAVLVALALLLTRCRAHLRARSRPGSGIKAERLTLLLLEDVCQVAVAAVGIWLLLSTYWWGGFFIAGALGWAYYTLWRTRPSQAVNHFIGLHDRAGR